MGRLVFRLMAVVVVVFSAWAGVTTVQGAVKRPCVTEDSVQAFCVWNASERGNGQGQSFVRVFGLRVNV